MSLSSLITSLEASLSRAGISSARTEAEMLAGHVLGLKRTDLHMRGDSEVAEAEEKRILELAARRQKRYPLQYITGECEFMSVEFAVKEGVFIPRPETEVLVESVLHRIAASGRMPRAILEIGTGCGVIAISLALVLEAVLRGEAPGAGWAGRTEGARDEDRPAEGRFDIVATDISPAAVRTARENARTHGLEKHMRFVVGDGINFLREGGPGVGGPGAGGRFDVLVCNPPYVATREIDGLEPEVRDHEPRAALDGGRDGLEFIRRIVPSLPSILTGGALAAFEMAPDQGETVMLLLRRAGADEVEIVKDLSGRDRVIIARMA